VWVLEVGINVRSVGRALMGNPNACDQSRIFSIVSRRVEGSV